jgi:hypothetical protein
VPLISFLHVLLIFTPAVVVVIVQKTHTQAISDPNKKKFDRRARKFFLHSSSSFCRPSTAAEASCRGSLFGCREGGEKKIKSKTNFFLL